MQCFGANVLAVRAKSGNCLFVQTSAKPLSERVKATRTDLHVFISEGEQAGGGKGGAAFLQNTFLLTYENNIVDQLLVFFSGRVGFPWLVPTA